MPENPGSSRSITRLLWLIMPLLLIAAALFAAYTMVQSRPKIEPRAKETVKPLVEIAITQPSNVQLIVTSQGNVEARRSTELTAEVSGQIIEVSADFVNGNRVKQGTLLAAIDATDYQAVLADARAKASEARLALAEEQVRSRQAAEDWQLINRAATQNGRQATGLTLRKPQLEKVKAQLAASEARIKQAEKNLARTQITAPFDGIIQNKSVDLGRYATPGLPITTLTGTDSIEIRLPINEQQLTHLGQSAQQTDVLLTKTSDPNGRHWRGTLDRIESIVDPVTRVYYAVVRVDHPYRIDASNPQPLRLGLFVTAQIPGITVKNAVQLPRIALIDATHLLIVDDQNQLRLRTVTVAQPGLEQITVTAGLSGGERVVLTRLPLYFDGMPVQVQATDESQ